MSIYIPTRDLIYSPYKDMNNELHHRKGYINVSYHLWANPMLLCKAFEYVKFFPTFYDPDTLTSNVKCLGMSPNFKKLESGETALNYNIIIYIDNEGYFVSADLKECE